MVEAVGQYLAAAARGQDIGAYDEVLTHLDRAAELLETLGRGRTAPVRAGRAAEPRPGQHGRRRLRGAPGGRGLRARPSTSASACARCPVWAWACTRRCTGSGPSTAPRATSAWPARSRSPSTSSLAQSDFPGGRPSYHACRGVEHFFAGSLPGAQEHLAQCVELFATDDVDYAEWPLPHDPLAAALAFVGPLRLITGDEAGALEAAASGLARCADLGFPMGPVSTGLRPPVRGLDAPAARRRRRRRLRRRRGGPRSASATASSTG